MFKTNEPDFTGHMINWQMINRELGPITPKGKHSAYLHTTFGLTMRIKGYEGVVMPMAFYSEKKIIEYYM